MPAVINYTSLISTLQAYLERGDGTTDPTVFGQLPLIINNGEKRIARALKIQGFENYVYGNFIPLVAVYAKPPLWRDTIALNFGSGPVLTVLSRATAANVRTLVTQQPTATIPGLAVGVQVTINGVGSVGYNGAFNLTAVGFNFISYASAGANEGVTPDTGTVFSAAQMTTVNYLRNRSREVVKAFWPNQGQGGLPRMYSDSGLNSILVVPTPLLAYPYEWGYWQLPQPLDQNNQTNYLTDFVPDILLYSCCLEMEPFLKEDSRIAVWTKFYTDGIAGLTAEEVMKLKDRAAQRNTA
jgi:hypothetical protein